MKYMVDGKKMKQLDDYTINEIGIPSLVLMERAALSFTNVLLEKITLKDSIIVLSGPGNNGADGVAVARLLMQKGYQVYVYIMGETSRFSKQLREQVSIATKLGVKFINNAKICEYNIVIDAIFGIGLSRPVHGEIKKVIQEVNESNAYVFSVDIPSGIDSACGKVLGNAIKADCTVTFGYQKLGMLMYPGCEYAGEVTVADIGFPSLEYAEITPTGYFYEKKDIKRVPFRPNDANKGTFGKVLVIAGTCGMSGACYMSAKAAYRTGAGLVKILTVEENRTILQSMLPEAIICTYHAETFSADIEKIKEQIGWATTIVFGPGVGKSDISKKLLELVLKESNVITVIDADGLNLLSEMGQLEELPIRKNFILTPHLKEMSRLMHCEVEDIKENMVEVAKEVTNRNHFVLVLKDARTLVVTKEKLYINISGNNGMSTGGSGDVLTGVIAGLLAQGMDPYEAACVGTYLHGVAGDYAKEKKGTYALMATDIIESISDALSYNKK